MDSYTQALLGAAVGEAVLGKKVGNWAPVWGAVAGIIPDLDIYFPPDQPALQWILLHRGWSHSLLFAIIAGIALGWILSKIHKNKPATWKDWSFLMFMGLFTHALLDCLTIFGTQLFYPFTNYRIELGSIAFRDYIYSGILLVTVVAVFFFKRTSTKRRWIINIGLGLSCLYLAFAGFNKIMGLQAFKKAMADQGIEYKRIMSGAQIYTSWRWYGLAETEDGFYTGYYNIYEDPSSIEFEYIPKNEEIVNNIKGTTSMNRIEWFTNDYYFAEREPDAIIVHDLRFGNPAYQKELDITEADFVFSFRIKEAEEGNLKVEFIGRD